MGLRRFGELLLLERLAEGGMAEVYRARQMGFAGFEKTVAVKRILPHIAKNERFKKLFRQEANLSATLQHNNITQVFSNGELEGYLYLVMEFVDGKNLRKLFSKAEKIEHRIPIEISCFIVAEFLRGLDYAHNCKDDLTGKALDIVHQDVSPQNIMLSYEGGVKVVDFGIAKAASHMDSQRSGALIGKLSYMSPEQARRELLDQKSDIFSSGIILWELLTQRRLFADKDENKAIEKVLKCKIPRPSLYNPIIPYTLEKIVFRALAPEKGDRYASCLEFCTDLVRYINDRHPGFVSLNFAEYMKEMFAKEIAKESALRDEIHSLIPDFLLKEAEAKKAAEAELREKTEEYKAPASQIPEAAKSAEVPDEKSQLYTDFEEYTDISQTKFSESGIPESKAVNVGEKPSESPEGVAPIKVIRSEKVPRIIIHRPPEINVVTPPPGFWNRKRLGKSALFLFVLGLMTMALPYLNSENLTYVKSRIANTLSFERIPNVKVEFEKNVKERVTPLFESLFAKLDNAKTRDLASEKTELPIRTPQEKRSSAPKVIPQETNLFVWEPRKMEVYGSVEIHGTPEADIIYIDGERLVDTEYQNVRTPLLNFHISPGKYQIKLENSLFGVSKTVTITVKEGKSHRIDAFLRK